MNHVPVVTGAARGLGAHLVDALLDRGTQKVYAFARDTTKVRQDPRVVAVAFDLQQPPTVPDDVTLLINNASTAEFAGPLDADPEAVHREMAINYAGTYATIRAFLPALEANQGAVVNVLSLLSLASAPPMAGYSASKAAMHSLTQALRPVLQARGIAVHGVYPAGIDTDMVAGVDTPKTAPRAVAEALLDGVQNGEEDIFPDPNSQAMSELWFSDPKAFERAFATS
jgi:short-subunit dehydrogenase